MALGADAGSTVTLKKENIFCFHVGIYNFLFIVNKIYQTICSKYFQNRKMYVCFVIFQCHTKYYDDPQEAFILYVKVVLQKLCSGCCEELPLIVAKARDIFNAFLS